MVANCLAPNPTCVWRPHAQPPRTEAWAWRWPKPGEAFRSEIISGPVTRQLGTRTTDRRSFCNRICLNQARLRNHVESNGSGTEATCQTVHNLQCMFLFCSRSTRHSKTLSCGQEGDRVVVRWDGLALARSTLDVTQSIHAGAHMSS